MKRNIFYKYNVLALNTTHGVREIAFVSAVQISGEFEGSIPEAKYLGSLMGCPAAHVGEPRLLHILLPYNTLLKLLHFPKNNIHDN